MASIPLLRLSFGLPSTVSTATHRKISSASLFHPLKSTFTLPAIKPQSEPHKNPKIIRSSSTPTPATDRLISSVGYFLPFLNGIQYGRFMFAQYPRLSLLFQPLLPIFSLYKSLPYASFVAFFALYLGVVRNPNFSRYVRFNAMQALVLDVLLVVPLLLQRILNPGRAGLGFTLMVMGYNWLFLFVVLCFVYSWVSTILGRTPYLPFVADAADRQL